MDNQLTQYIHHFPNIVPPELLKQLMEMATEEEGWQPPRIRNGEIDTSIRDCNLKFFTKHAVLDAEVYKVISEAAQRYVSHYPYLALSKDEGYAVLRYREGQHYREHVDMMDKPRVVACSLILNDDYEGGEVTFFDGTFTPVVKAGDVLMWPSNFMYPHAVNKVTQGVRYSLVTWLS